MKRIRSRDYHTNAYHIQLMKQPEVIEIAVKERVLVVPFHFDGDAIPEIVNIVSRSIVCLSINLN